MDFATIDLTAITAITLGSLCVLIPVGGLTLRLCLKPLVEALARVLEASRGRQELSLLEKRQELLERQLELLVDHLGRVESELSRVKALPPGELLEKR